MTNSSGTEAAGASTDEAIATATAHEGRASLTTAIINSCGFAVLLLSEYKPSAWFGEYGSERDHSG